VTPLDQEKDMAKADVTDDRALLARASFPFSGFTVNIGDPRYSGRDVLQVMTSVSLPRPRGFV
jgi:hypothetical protein